MFHLNDLVRVIPRSYVDLSKSFFNDPRKWQDFDSQEDNVVMLGGEYNILSIQKSGGRTWYKLLQNNPNNEAMVSDSLIVKSGDLRKCPFQVGDKVIFHPKCSMQDEQFLVSGLEEPYGLLDRRKLHDVTCVLNDYFIFVDFDIQSPYSFPFRWEDFELSN